MEQYYTGQICLSGHCITSTFLETGRSENKFCQKCWAKTITECQDCGTKIRGKVINVGVVLGGPAYVPPDFCFNCGKPFPWLESKMKAAIEFAELEEVLSAEETEKFTRYVNDISMDTPSSQVSAKKINILLRKFASSSVVAIRALLVDIASETAKKIILDSKP